MKASPLGESPKKVPASFPLLGNVPKNFRLVFPYWGMFQKSSGKVSPIGESSPEMLADFPNVGNVSMEAGLSFPNLGSSQANSTLTWANFI